MCSKVLAPELELDRLALLLRPPYVVCSQAEQEEADPGLAKAVTAAAAIPTAAPTPAAAASTAASAAAAAAAAEGWRTAVARGFCCNAGELGSGEPAGCSCLLGDEACHHAGGPCRGNAAGAAESQPHLQSHASQLCREQRGRAEAREQGSVWRGGRSASGSTGRRGRAIASPSMQGPQPTRHHKIGL